MPVRVAAARSLAPMPREDLNHGIMRTEISPALAWAMTVGFLAVILALPVVQATIELA